MKIQEEFAGYGDGGAARIGLLRQFTQPWKEGGWIPWSVLAFGLAVFGVMTAVVVIYLGRTAVVIDIKDPGVAVVVKGTTLTITGPDKQSVKIVPGDQELTISCAGLETKTKSFTIKKGETKAVTVSIVNSEIVALLENEIAPPTPDHEKTTAATSPPTSNSATTLPPTITNSLGMEFVRVPKGKSWLGGGGGNPGGEEVVIDRDFYLGKYEVTQDEWQKVTGLTPSFFSRTGGGKDIVKDVADAQLKRFPVDQVSWDDVQAFLERLNKNEREAGWVYRLPNEVEWEYACRGGPLSDKFESAYDFYFEKPTNQLLPEQANFGLTGLKRTCKVGSYNPNRLGLCDMPGNVGEWCDDAKKWADGTDRRVHRGGDWGAGSEICRPAAWFADAASTRSNNIGFRVARVPVEKSAAAVPTVKKPDYDAVARGKWIPLVAGETYVQDQSIPIPGQRAGDLIIRARVKKVSGKNLAITIRRNPPKRGSYCAWFAGGHSFGILKWNDDGRKIDLGEWRAPANFEDRFEFAFSAVGDVLTIYAEGKRIGEVRDADYRLGALEIGAYRGRSLFQDVEIMILDKAVPSTDELHGIENQELSPKSASAAAPADRRTAESVLSLGGSVTIRVNGQEQAIESGNTVPAEAFRLVRIAFPENAQKADAALKSLHDLTELEVLWLQYVPVTDATLSRLSALTKTRLLDIGGTHVTDAGLMHLEGLAKLDYLNVGETGVTDVGLQHVRNLRQLKVLGLNGTPVTDAGLAHLEGLTKLEHLWIERTQIRGSGLKHLRKLVRLQKIAMANTGVTDGDLVHLRELEALEALNLAGTSIAGPGLANLKSLTRLRELDLSNSRLTNAGLVHLKSLPQLKKVRLRGTGVTDAGLQNLEAMRHLRELDLSDTKVTAAGVEKIKKSLPACRIIANPPAP